MAEAELRNATRAFDADFVPRSPLTPGLTTRDLRTIMKAVS
ncbi:MAG: hypothetical protein ACPMAQ_01190 [Phycisphaerae bacterium]